MATEMVMYSLPHCWCDAVALTRAPQRWQDSRKRVRRRSSELRLTACQEDQDQKGGADTDNPPELIPSLRLSGRRRGPRPGLCCPRRSPPATPPPPALLPPNCPPSS